MSSNEIIIKYNEINSISKDEEYYISSSNFVIVPSMKVPTHG